jgi:exopolysaccharide production protein ExoQ
MSSRPAYGPSWQGLALMHTRQAKWLAVFAAFTPLFFQIQLKGLGILIMLAVLGGYVITLSKAEMLRVLKVTPILAYPLLALLSSFWSEAPALTFRLSLQFLITAGIGIIFYRTVPFRTFLTALFGAALLACVCAPFFDPTSIPRGDPLTGVAGSKNMMAFYASLAAMAGLAIALDRQIRVRTRGIAVVGGIYSAIIMVLAQSAGAMVGTVIGAGVLLAARFFMVASGSVRTLIVVAVLLMLPVGVISQQVVTSEAATFGEDVLGKDISTLTGRTYLWERAGQYISEKPIVGHGYSAFWRQGSVEAEGLWRAYNIRNRAGFNFHNQFYEVLVDVGYLGLAVFVSMLLLSAVALAMRLLRERSPELPFVAAMFVVLAVRMPVESVMLNTFSVFTITLFLLTTASIYGQGDGPVRAAVSREARRQRIRNVKQDKGLMQLRATPKKASRKSRQVVQTRAPRAVVGRRVKRGKRVLRQTRVPLGGEGPPASPATSPENSQD